MAYVFKKSSSALCVPKASEIPSSPTFRLQGIILPLSKTKRNRCSSSASLSENFQKCWIGYTKKKLIYQTQLVWREKLKSFSTSKNAQDIIIDEGKKF